ncbi:MAG TPA: (S)-benzoin forming benzil reductase [Balneolales bacterium]|nr:(S)-benzoin forming benzil reductase [Balneolales bacterium]
MRHIIITGASRGFGAKLAENFAKKNITLHLIARSDLSDLKSELSKKASDVFSYQFDLSKSEDIINLHQQVFKNIQKEDTDWIVLINNAGLLKPMGPVGKYPVDDYRVNLEVNFIAPLLLTHLFVNELKEFKGEKRVVMISSGAANKAYYGWSHYCSTKAGVNRFMEVVSLEQKDLDYPVKILAFNPGKMETNMQKEIRSQKKEDFLFVKKFINAKEHGLVGDPEIVSQKLIEVVWSENFPDGEIINFADI